MLNLDLGQLYRLDRADRDSWACRGKNRRRRFSRTGTAVSDGPWSGVRWRLAGTSLAPAHGKCEPRFHISSVRAPLQEGIRERPQARLRSVVHTLCHPDLPDPERRREFRPEHRRKLQPGDADTIALPLPPSDRARSGSWVPPGPGMFLV